MWWLVGILKWTVDWLSFYWTIKTALNGTTQRRMASAYLLNFYCFFFLFSPSWNTFFCSWLACKGHIWISQKFKIDLYFKWETTELHRLFLSSRRFPWIIELFPPDILRRVIDQTPARGFFFYVDWTTKSYKASNKTIHFRCI